MAQALLTAAEGARLQRYAVAENDDPGEGSKDQKPNNREAFVRMLRGPPGGSLKDGNIVKRAQKDVHRLGPYRAFAQIRAQGVNLHIADAGDAHQTAVFTEPAPTE